MTTRTTETESALVERAKAGDFDAFEFLVHSTEDRIYGHLLRMVGNGPDAQELLQETFLSAYKNLKSFEGKSSFSTWVYRIATNHALMSFRKKRPEIPMEELPIPTHEELKGRAIRDWEIDPSEAAHTREVKALLEEAVAKLPPPYRAVVVMRDIEGLSTAETAELLNINEGAVKTRLHRARIFLRELLNPYFGNEETSSSGGKQG